MVVEALDMALSGQGFTVHPASTYRAAKVLLTVIGDRLAAVIAHADMPGQPKPGSLLRLVRLSHPEAAIVVLSARAKSELGPLPRGAILLREPFDRAELLASIAQASDPRNPLTTSSSP